LDTTRQDVINWGLKYLQEVGINSICSVCIANGGSCCHGCAHLQPGVGCQTRNTGCTSWLCGYLLVIFHDAGLLAAWNDFWKQVPGLGYRRDSTPAELSIDKWIDPQNLRMLTTAFSEDLQELAQQTTRHRHVIKLNDILYRMITLEYDFKLHGEDGYIALNKRLARLLRDFKRYSAIKKLCACRTSRQQEG
jgi:hypothetical protein